MSQDVQARERRAAAIGEAALADVIEQLNRGLSLRRACAVASVDVAALRWLRYGNPKVARRVNEARQRGLLDSAARCRQRASKLEKRAAGIGAEWDRIFGTRNSAA